MCTLCSGPIQSIALSAYTLYDSKMYNDREILTGYWPWDDDREQGFLVRARRNSGVPEGEIDHTAEILMFDAEGDLTDFERTLEDYQGEDRRGTPTTDLTDGDISEFLPNY